MTYTTTTVAARAKFASAHGQGTPVAKVVQVGWGDGGYDSELDEVIEPSPNATIVPGEFLRKNINDISMLDTITIRYMISLEKNEGNDYNVSSCGLYDENGVLIALKNFFPRVKDDETLITIQWDEQF